jgi:hypothetical protein
MIVTAFVVVMVVVSVRPRGKRVGEVAPRLFASSHFVIAEQTTIELTLKRVPTNIDGHYSQRLPAIAEWFLPFFAGARWHFGFTGVGIARRPPMTGRHALKLRPSEIEAAHFFHSRSEPKKSFSTKNAA